MLGCHQGRYLPTFLTIKREKDFLMYRRKSVLSIQLLLRENYSNVALEYFAEQSIRLAVTSPH